MVGWSLTVRPALDPLELRAVEGRLSSEWQRVDTQRDESGWRVTEPASHDRSIWNDLYRLCGESHRLIIGCFTGDIAVSPPIDYPSDFQAAGDSVFIEVECADGRAVHIAGREASEKGLEDTLYDFRYEVPERQQIVKWNAVVRTTRKRGDEAKIAPSMLGPFDPFPMG